MDYLRSKLTISSYNNLIDVEDVMNSSIGKEFLKAVGTDSIFNNKTLQTTFKRFYDCYKTDNIDIISKDITDFTDISELESIINSGGFGLGDMTTHIKKLDKRCLVDVKLKELDLYFRLYIYYKDSNSSSINFIIKRLDTILGYNKDENRVKFLAEALQKNPFSIYFILYPVGRTTYKRYQKDPIKEMNKLANQGCYNASSGYTIMHIDGDNINNKRHSHYNMLVTRIPEMLGLFTHELGHLLGYDFEVPIKETSKQTIYTSSYAIFGGLRLNNNDLNLPLQSNMDIHLSEAFCNTNTTLIHTICNALNLCESQKQIHDYEKCYDLFKSLYKIELFYAIYHSAKILYWLGYNNFDDFFNGKSKIVYKQKAYLFEYTIIRSFILLIYNDLINKMSVDKNEGFLKFKLNNDDVYTGTNKGRFIKDIDDKLNNIKKTLVDLMTNQEPNIIRDSYAKVFDLFIKKIEETDTNKNSYNGCGDINMEFFCIDQNSISMKGGSLNIDYKRKYLKYKTKYLSKSKRSFL